MYSGLDQLLDRVVSSKPQVLILVGPFIDSQAETDIDGVINYFDPNEGEHVFLEYRDLFKIIFQMIEERLKGLKTRILVVPSFRDTLMLSPLPQQPFDQSLFPKSLNVTLLANP